MTGCEFRLRSVLGRGETYACGEPAEVGGVCAAHFVSTLPDAVRPRGPRSAHFGCPECGADMYYIRPHTEEPCELACYRRACPAFGRRIEVAR